HATHWSSSLSFSSIRTTYLEPYLITPLSRVLASSTPDLVSVLLLLAILVVSLKVLDYARRVVMFWVMLVVRVVFYGSLVALGCYVYSVGVEKAGRDLGWLLGVLWGFVEEVLAGVESGRSPSGGPGAGGYYVCAGATRYVQSLVRFLSCASVPAALANNKPGGPALMRFDGDTHIG
ncbi:hypothetical protein KXW91_006113, partial [Aspergillus fumigatus]